MSNSEPGILKSVAVVSERADLPGQIIEDLAEPAGGENVRAFGEGAILVHCPDDVAELRDRLAGRLNPEDRLLVVEFERWAVFSALDREWLPA